MSAQAVVEEQHPRAKLGKAKEKESGVQRKECRILGGAKAKAEKLKAKARKASTAWAMHLGESGILEWPQIDQLHGLHHSQLEVDPATHRRMIGGEATAGVKDGETDITTG